MYIYIYSMFKCIWLINNGGIRIKKKASYNIEYVLVLPLNNGILLRCLNKASLMYNPHLFIQVTLHKLLSVIRSYNFIFVLNWFCTRVIYFNKTFLVSDLLCIKCTQVYILKSSTIVRKNLWPCIKATLVGPHMSIWMSWKILLETWSLWVKGNLRCLARWHDSQTWLLLK